MGLVMGINDETSYVHVYDVFYSSDLVDTSMQSKTQRVR